MGPGERREASRLLGVPWVGRGWKAELLGLDVPPLPGEAAFLPTGPEGHTGPGWKDGLSLATGQRRPFV